MVTIDRPNTKALTTEMDEHALEEWWKENKVSVDKYHFNRTLSFQVMTLEERTRAIGANYLIRGVDDSDYYIGWIDRLPGKKPFLAWIRMSNHWGKFKEGLDWELQGGERKKDGKYSVEYQAGYIPINRDTGEIIHHLNDQRIESADKMKEESLDIHEESPNTNKRRKELISGARSTLDWVMSLINYN